MTDEPSMYDDDPCVACDAPLEECEDCMWNEDVWGDDDEEDMI